MSKGLEKLARIKGHFNPKDIANKELFEEDFDTIEKELKALKIIKEHIIYDQETNVLKANFQWYIRNKDEQDLLKEVLL